LSDVTVAKDGQEAFELVKESMEQKKLFNLIFMDIQVCTHGCEHQFFFSSANLDQMPNLDGLQSTRLIRGMGYSAPIVALTAFAEESNVKECLDSGMDYFLPKPIRRPALKQVLRRYCATIEEAAEESESPSVPRKPDGAPPEKGVDSSTQAKKPEDKIPDPIDAPMDKDAIMDDQVSPMS